MEWKKKISWRRRRIGGENRIEEDLEENRRSRKHYLRNDEALEGAVKRKPEGYNLTLWNHQARKKARRKRRKLFKGERKSHHRKHDSSATISRKENISETAAARKLAANALLPAALHACWKLWKRSAAKTSGSHAAGRCSFCPGCCGSAGNIARKQRFNNGIVSAKWLKIHLEAKMKNDNNLGGENMAADIWKWRWHLWAAGVIPRHEKHLRQKKKWKATSWKSETKMKKKNTKWRERKWRKWRSEEWKMKRNERKHWPSGWPTRRLFEEKRRLKAGI